MKADMEMVCNNACTVYVSCMVPPIICRQLFVALIRMELFFCLQLSHEPFQFHANTIKWNESDILLFVVFLLFFCDCFYLEFYMCMCFTLDHFSRLAFVNW